MKKYGREMNRRRFLHCAIKSALVLSVVPKTSATADSVPLARPNYTYLKDLLTPFRGNYDLPALAAGVMKNGVVVASGAVGIRKVGDPTPVTMLDKFHLGSCTKAFTATLAAMLVEQGKIRWDSTMAEIFPERVARLRDYQNVTLELLLWHRSGVPPDPPADWWKTYTNWCSENGIPPGTWPDDMMDPRMITARLEYIDLVLAQPPIFKLGTQFHYSNNAYIIAGCMIERVTGVPWEDLIRQRLFLPLGMTSAGFGPCQKPDQTDQPWGHHYEEGRFMPVYGDNLEVMGPSSTIHCALLDYLKFADLHTSEGRREPRLMSQASFAKLHTAPPGQNYAMGWRSENQPWAKGQGLSHIGSNTMNYFIVGVAPDIDFCMAVATNSSTHQKDSKGKWYGGEKSSEVLVEVSHELARRFAGQIDSATPGVSAFPPAESKPSAAERLKELKELYDQGLISRDIYDQKKKEILNSL